MRFLSTRLLGLLKAGAAHGYRLHQTLGEAGLDPDEIDSSLVYRTLRDIERKGWVRSRRSPEGRRKRVYTITSAGERQLALEIEGLRHTRDEIECLVAVHDSRWSRELETNEPIVVITASAPHTGAPLDPHFGRCAYFALARLGTWQFVPNPAIDRGVGAGEAAARIVIDHGATAVISGEFGPHASDLLEAAGIALVVADEDMLATAGTVAALVDYYRSCDFGLQLPAVAPDDT